MRQCPEVLPSRNAVGRLATSARSTLFDPSSLRLFSPKSYFLSMQLFSKAGLLQFDTHQLGSVENMFVPVDQVILVTKNCY